MKASNKIIYILNNPSWLLPVYLSSFVNFALVASAVPCALTMDRIHFAPMPSHKRTAPSFEAVTYILPVAEYLICTIIKHELWEFHLHLRGFGLCKILKNEVHSTWFIAPLFPISGTFADRKHWKVLTSYKWGIWWSVPEVFIHVRIMRHQPLLIWFH